MERNFKTAAETPLRIPSERLRIFPLLNAAVRRRSSPPEPEAEDEGNGVGRFFFLTGEAGGFAVLL
jgi:hypothetical protein